MFKISIVGYSEAWALKKIDDSINTLLKEHIVVFCYSHNVDIPIKNKIINVTRGENSLEVDFSIEAISLGYGDTLEFIPRGCKFALILKGSSDDIDKIKSIIPETKGWVGDLEEEITATLEPCQKNKIHRKRKVPYGDIPKGNRQQK